MQRLTTSDQINYRKTRRIEYAFCVTGSPGVADMTWLEVRTGNDFEDLQVAEQYGY